MRRPYGVLDVRVSTRRLQDWARLERQRAYLLALISALLVALGVAVLTARWVGRPLAEIGRAMAGAHGGRQGRTAGPRDRSTGVQGAGPALQSAAGGSRRAGTGERRTGHAAVAGGTRSGFDRLPLLQETAAGFAHEIGTPLNTMSGHLQLLRDDLDGQQDEAAVDRVRLLLAQVDRVAGIVRAALQRGTWPKPYVQSIDLTEIVGRMLRFSSPRSPTPASPRGCFPRPGLRELRPGDGRADPAQPAEERDRGALARQYGRHRDRAIEGLEASIDISMMARGSMPKPRRTCSGRSPPPRAPRAPASGSPSAAGWPGRSAATWSTCRASAAYGGG